MKQTIAMVAVLGLCCGLTACAEWPRSEFGFENPDKILFERAMAAVENERYSVARITLHTLINTYPDSEYAEKARVTLEDPRIAACDEL